MARYMKAPLDLTVEQLNIYTLLYKKADFTSWEADYTFEQLVTDSHKKLGITKRIAMRIIDDFIKLGYIEVIRKGTRGNNSVYRILTENIFTDKRTESVPNPYQISTESVPNGIALQTLVEEASTESVPNPYQISTASVPPIIKTETEIIKNNSISDIELSVDRIRKELPREMTKISKSITKLKPLIKKYSEEQLIKSIKLYEQDVIKKRNNGFKELNFCNESTFWNGRYMDFLQESNNVEIPIRKVEIKEVSYNPFRGGDN